MSLRTLASAALRLLAAALLLLAAAAAAAETREPTVLWLSLDGVRHDMIDAERTPALARIARDGGRADALVPVFPSITFPNHVSLATGTHPDRHGIVANRFHDPELGFFDYGNDAGFLEAEPIWAAAERQGRRSAAFFWVMSETDWRGTGATYRKTPFDGGLGEAEKVDQLLAWLDLPAAARPQLLMSWWHGADAAGHRHGPDSPETRAQLQGQDRELARLLEGLDARGWWKDLTLVVVSDHGMTEAGSLLDARGVLGDAGVAAQVVHGTSVALVRLADPSQQAAAIRSFDAHDGVRAVPADRVPEALRYRHATRTGDLVVLADPPVRLGGTRRRAIEFLQRMTGSGTPGAHGYDPARFPDMHGVLLAMGRGVDPGTRFGRPHATDLAATVAALLGIAPPASSEGTPMPGLGRPRVAAPIAPPGAAPAP